MTGPSLRQLRIALLGIAILSAGCAEQNHNLRAQVARADLGRARADLLERPIDNKRQRGYMLQRLRTLITTVGDGYAYDNPMVLEIFDILRTQGINDDRTAAAAILWDGVRFWKGEPFEQAMAYYYIAAHFAQRDDWSNARAAALGSMFPLRSFGTDRDGRDLPQAALPDRIVEGRGAEQGDETRIGGYVVEPTDFALGYLMAGIANRQLSLEGDAARADEAADQFAQAVRLNPGLAHVASTLQSGACNTILLVEYGTGPQKIGTGPDNAIADFRPLVRSDMRGLNARVNGIPAPAAPIACDVNTMAASHRWNNLEDVRLAKSHLGTGLMIAGAGIGMYGSANGHRDASYVGLGMILAGAAMKATAQANVEYCEAIPQRIYVVPLNITEPLSTVRLDIDGLPGARMVLPDLSPPRDRAVQVRVVRLANVWTPRGVQSYRHASQRRDPARPSVRGASTAWTDSGQVFYANEYNPTAGRLPFPYVLGGTDASAPSQAALDRYQAAGFLQGVTLSQLQAAYRAEHLVWTPQDVAGVPGAHVLEGGRSLLTPPPGTTGYTRLFCQLAPPYRPRSMALKELAAQARTEMMQRQAAHAAPESGETRPEESSHSPEVFP